MAKLLQSEELLKRAEELGVDVTGEPRSHSVSGSSSKHPNMKYKEE